MAASRRRAHISDCVEAKIYGIAKLSSDRTVFQNRVRPFTVYSHCCGFEMFHILPKPESLSGQ
jgi:hypothetical protein